MSLLAASQITAIATAVLAVFAIVTAVFAVAAFVKQREEVRTLQQEGEHQGRLLEVQAGQLEVQREQLAGQREASQRQAEVAELQAQELRESLEERKRQAAQQRSAQASRVFILLNVHEPMTLPWRASEEREEASGERPRWEVTANVSNNSELAIYDVLISWLLGTVPLSLDPVHQILPSGTGGTTTRPVPPSMEPEKLSAVAYFRDAAGITWLTRPDGRFDDVPEDQIPLHTW
jgi:hypothetical protein